MKHALMAVGLLAAAACSQSLSAKCDDFCEELAECPDASDAVTGCSAECTEVEDTYGGTSCEDHVAELLDCLAEDDICVAVETDESCPNERSNLEACGVAYCRDNPDDQRCDDDPVSL